MEYPIKYWFILLYFLKCLFAIATNQINVKFHAV